jgi:hypothetical protein
LIVKNISLALSRSENISLFLKREDVLVGRVLKDRRKIKVRKMSTRKKLIRSGFET